MVQFNTEGGSVALWLKNGPCIVSQRFHRWMYTTFNLSLFRKIHGCVNSAMYKKYKLCGSDWMVHLLSKSDIEI